LALEIIQFDKPFTVFSREADKDYLLARMISFVGGGFEAKAGLLGHQACEKYMKAVMVQANATYAETHKLLELANFCEPRDAYFGEPETTRILEQFDIFDQIGRYGAAANFDPLAKGGSAGGLTVQIGPGIQAAGLSVWTPKHLSDLDGFVFKARSLLDFVKAKHNDGLKSILANDQKSSLIATWKGPWSLQEILTADNAHFKA